MGTLIGIEVKKLLHRRKTLITASAFLILIGIVAYGFYKQELDRRKWDNPQQPIQDMEYIVKTLQSKLNNPSTSEERKKVYSKEIEKLKTNIEDLKNHNWRKTVEKEIDDNVRVLEKEKDLVIQEELRASIKSKEYLLKYNIEPEGKKVTAYGFIVDIFEKFGVIFLAVGIGLFAADMVSGECTTPTLKLLLTQPISRGKVLLSKFIAVIVTSNIMIISIELIAFLIIGLILGFGNFNYPMEVGTKYRWDMLQVVPLSPIAGSTYIITRKIFIVKMFLLQMLGITAVVSFAFMLSSILKSSMESVTLSVVTPVVLLVITLEQSLNKFNMVMFSNHLNPVAVMEGSLAMKFKNPAITSTFSIVLLVGWIVICYVISHLVFTKKDILI